MKNREYVISRMGTRIDFGNSLGEAVDDLEECLEAYKETRWIPVSDRLPEKEDGDKYGTVLWCILYKEQHQLICDGHYQWKSKDGSQTHWMPLPEPPEQEV